MGKISAKISCDPVVTDPRSRNVFAFSPNTPANVAARKIWLGDGGCVICACHEFRGTAETLCSNSNGLGGRCNHEYDQHYD